MRERRIIEIVVCALYVLVLSAGAAETPGSGGRYEEGFAFMGLSILLMVFATVMTLVRRDLLFRVLLYPVALLAGSTLLLLDIRQAYGYGWDTFWSSYPHGVASALIGLAYVFLLNGVIPAVWRGFLRRRPSGRGQSRGASGM